MIIANKRTAQKNPLLSLRVGFSAFLPDNERYYFVDYSGVIPAIIAANVIRLAVANKTTREIEANTFCFLNDTAVNRIATIKKVQMTMIDCDPFKNNKDENPAIGTMLNSNI